MMPDPTRQSLNPSEPGISMRAEARVRVFISHAKADEKIAGALLEFIEASLEMPEGSIRCTSVPGYGHSTGTVTADAIRAELQSASCVVGLITSTSVESPWVMFELGARWGLGLASAPVLHPLYEFNELPAALRGTHAAKLDSEAGMVQLIDDIERDSGCRKRATAKILMGARKLVEFARGLSTPPSGVGAAIDPELATKVAAIIQESSSGGASTRHAEALLELGPRDLVLPIVLREQERVIRYRMTRVVERRVLGMHQPPSYARSHLENLRLTVAEYLDRDRTGSEDALVEFGRSLYETSRLKGDAYDREFCEQAYFLASEIRDAFGDSCGHLMSRLVPAGADGLKNELGHLWSTIGGERLPDAMRGTR